LFTAEIAKNAEKNATPSPLGGEGWALHHVGCRTKALNLIWFRGEG